MIPMLVLVAAFLMMIASRKSKERKLLESTHSPTFKWELSYRDPVG